MAMYATRLLAAFAVLALTAIRAEGSLLSFNFTGVVQLNQLPALLADEPGSAVGQPITGSFSIDTVPLPIPQQYPLTAFQLSFPQSPSSPPLNLTGSSKIGITDGSQTVNGVTSPDKLTSFLGPNLVYSPNGHVYTLSGGIGGLNHWASLDSPDFESIVTSFTGGQVFIGVFPNTFIAAINSVTLVPEPSSIILAGSGIIALMLVRRRPRA